MTEHRTRKRFGQHFLHDRNLVDRMALAMQASLLIRHSDPAVADAFCASRLQSAGGLNYGNLPSGTDAAAIIKRATPVVG